MGNTEGVGMKYVTTRRRFELGAFPPICVLTGADADQLVPVAAHRNALLPWFFFPFAPIVYLVMSVVPRPPVTGRLPLSDPSLAESVDVMVERGVGVVVGNAHPTFVARARNTGSR